MDGKLVGGEDPGKGRTEPNWLDCLKDDVQAFLEPRTVLRWTADSHSELTEPYGPLLFSDLCILLFLFLSLCRLCVCVFLCSHWSLVDVPLIFFCPADHVPDWQPRVLLGMVEARSVNVKKTTTTTTAKINDGAPWHKGVLQGAEKIMTSWHKEEEEASRRRATKRNFHDLEPPTHL